jgi:mycothiol synthase
VSCPIDVRRHDRLSAEAQQAVHALADRIEDETGSPPLSDHTQLQLAVSRADLVHLIAYDGERLLGYGQLDREGCELVADTDATYRAVLGHVQHEVGPRLRVWTHGASSALAPLLSEKGYRQIRLLHQLRLPLPAPLPEPEIADGVTVRPFTVGTDEDAWLQVNAAAFAEHPEQGGWDRSDLLAREAEPWFDPAGFFCAFRLADGELLGFHWTKVHPNGAGEVYVIGVAPAAQGLHLGAALLTVGLRHLAGRGCPYVLLYVEDDNAAALRLYERFGFVRHDLDAQWRQTEA